jgi:hypothetical protein
MSAATSLAACLALRRNPSPDDLARALELSKQGKETPYAGFAVIAWSTTGIVHYRRGDWKAALPALVKAADLFTGYYKCRNDFFLAMTHQRLGNQDKARQHYDSAVEWMAKNQSRTPDLPRFRKEAASVLGIKDEPKKNAR